MAKRDATQSPDSSTRGAVGANPASEPSWNRVDTMREAMTIQTDGLIRAQRLLDDSREKYTDLFDFAPVPFCVLDGIGAVMEINLAAAALFDKERSRILGMPLRQFIAFSDRVPFLDHMRRCRSERGQIRSVIRFVTPRDPALELELISRRSLRSETAGISFPTTLVDRTDRRQALDQRDALMRKLIGVQEDERRRLSRELHDELGQHVTALILGLRSLDRAASEEDRRTLDHLLEIANHIGQESHRLATNLRPTALDDLGLDSAVQQYLHDWRQSTQIAADYDCLGPPAQRLASHIETTVYRVAQESLCNVAKHSGAKYVSVLMEFKRNEVRMIVEDDGRGFDPGVIIPEAVSQNRIGLIGMRERVEMSGGSFELESGPGSGTTIYVRIPFDAALEELPC